MAQGQFHSHAEIGCTLQSCTECIALHCTVMCAKGLCCSVSLLYTVVPEPRSLALHIIVLDLNCQLTTSVSGGSCVTYDTVMFGFVVHCFAAGQKVQFCLSSALFPNKTNLLHTHHTTQASPRWVCGEIHQINILLPHFAILWGFFAQGKTAKKEVAFLP